MIYGAGGKVIALPLVPDNIVEEPDVPAVPAVPAVPV
jgi:hypothetical protein